MPDYNEYLESIYSLLQTFLKEGVSLTEDTELVTELGLTSLQVMTMIEHIEDHFDISIPLNILPEIRTVRDLAQKLVELR
jgi:acyl carrier protein